MADSWEVGKCQKWSALKPKNSWYYLLIYILMTSSYSNVFESSSLAPNWWWLMDFERRFTSKFYRAPAHHNDAVWIWKVKGRMRRGVKGTVIMLNRLEISSVFTSSAIVYSFYSITFQVIWRKCKVNDKMKMEEKGWVQCFRISGLKAKFLIESGNIYYPSSQVEMSCEGGLSLYLIRCCCCFSPKCSAAIRDRGYQINLKIQFLTFPD